MNKENIMIAEDKMLVEIGKLQGQLIERERSRDELKGLLDAMQDDLDLMRERAVKAETDARHYKVAINQIDGIKL